MTTEFYRKLNLFELWHTKLLKLKVSEMSMQQS